MDSRDPSTRRWLMVLTAAAVASTLVGVVSATRRAPPPAGYALHRSDRRQDRQPAPTNAELASGRASDNRLRQSSNLAQLAAAASASPPRDEAAWRAALSRRSELRAYDGAPPLIPHPIDQRGYPNCSTCHERSLRIGDKLAPLPSHTAQASCTQCHVVARSSVPLLPELRADPPFDNGFAGLEPAGKGARAWPGAPPLIPHKTFMRERCASCHGALSGLHSSHAERQSCTQCHAPSAELDQHAPLALTKPAAGAAR